MYCTSCSKEISEKLNFCPGCGAKILKINKNQYQSSKYQDNMYLISNFYVEKFDFFSNNGGDREVSWNWWAFIFDWIWYFYKGMWQKALVLMAVYFVLFPFSLIFVHIYTGLYGTYDFYLTSVRKKNGGREGAAECFAEIVVIILLIVPSFVANVAGKH